MTVSTTIMMIIIIIIIIICDFLSLVHGCHFTEQLYVDVGSGHMCVTGVRNRLWERVCTLCVPPARTTVWSLNCGKVTISILYNYSVLCIIPSCTKVRETVLLIFHLLFFSSLFPCYFPLSLPCLFSPSLCALHLSSPFLFYLPTMLFTHFSFIF